MIVKMFIAKWRGSRITLGYFYRMNFVNFFAHRSFKLNTFQIPTKLQHDTGKKSRVNRRLYEANLVYFGGSRFPYFKTSRSSSPTAITTWKVNTNILRKRSNKMIANSPPAPKNATIISPSPRSAIPSSFPPVSSPIQIATLQVPSLTVGFPSIPTAPTMPNLPPLPCPSACQTFHLSLPPLL